MSLITCADLPVMSGRISLVLNGGWSASLMLAGESDSAPTGSVKIKAEGGFDLAAFIRAGGVDRKNTVHALLVGGAGGLDKLVSGSYRSPQLRDPLERATKAAGDTLSSSVSESLLSKQVPHWTTLERRVRLEYSAIAREAGLDVHWRYEPDGKLWLGEESWPAQELPDGTVIVNTDPSLGRTILAVTTPALLPGVDLEGIGRIEAVDHWIQHDRVRSIVWA